MTPSGSRSVLREFLKASRILVHGHRGARAILPENTIPAFKYAIECGADFIEMDVLATKDDELVVAHDPHINNTLCTGGPTGVAIRELMLAELKHYDCGALKNPRFPKQQPVPGTRIPTLDEVLSLGDGSSIQFNIEVKSFPDHPELTPPPEAFSNMLLEVIRARELESRCIVQSFDFRILHALRKLAPETCLAALWHGPRRPFVDIAREAETAIVAPLFQLVTSERVALAHEANIAVVPWTVNSTNEWEPMISAGVDGIITDDPAELIAYLKQRGLR
jgi:glycerophosphoryl diester phosphodiesterase